MRTIAGFILSVFCLAVVACNDGTTTADNTAATDSASNGSTADFKLGVQMWTFRLFTLTEALDKVDSAGIKYIEAFYGQKLGGNMTGEFGMDMSADNRQKLKDLLKTKGITMVAMGVIVPQNAQEWEKSFQLGKDMGLSYITCEPIKSHWDLIDSLSGVYGVKVAIHDHPKPNMYWSPDSVLAAVNGHQNIGACADIGHWARNGLDPVESLKKLEGHIIGAHLKDIVKFNDTQAADTVVSKGVIDVPAVLAELKRQSFNGMLSIEHESNWEHNLPDVIEIKQYYDAQLSKLK